MEDNQSGISPYYHHHQQQQSTTATTSAAVSSFAATNGVFSNSHQHNASSGHYSSSEGTRLVFPPHSVTGRAPVPSSAPPETVKRKRGRPRKYGTAEAPLSASASASKELCPPSSRPPKKGSSSTSSYSSYFKRSQLGALGITGQAFTPHVISVAAGEDVAQKIMLFTQQRKREVCILSASGSISTASLRQPATLEGNVTYEGRFEILSLSGSFLHTEIGGRTGGLSVCLSGTDGRIVGGGVGGPLKAAGPVQVIVGSFVVDTKKNVNTGSMVDSSASKLPSPVVEVSISTAGFRPTPDTSGRISARGNDNHQHFDGNHFMLQPPGMHVMPSQSTDWRGGLDARIGPNSDITGKVGHEACHSPEDLR